MREPRAILRSILRSYALRGLIGFGVAGGLIGVPQLLSPSHGGNASVFLHVVAFIVGILSLVVGPAFAAALLIDDERGWRRIASSLAFGALFLPIFLVAGALLFFGFMSLADVLYGGPAQAPHIEAFAGVLIGATGGIAVGFCTLLLKRRMKIARAQGSLIWLFAFLAFLLGGSAAWAATLASSLSRPGQVSELRELAFPLITFAFGGLLFGLGLDLLWWSARGKQTAELVSASSAAPPSMAARVLAWVARCLLIALILAILVAGSIFVSHTERHARSARRSLRAGEMLHAKKYTEAIQEYEAALRETPKDTFLTSDLADAYYKSGRYQDAVREYEAAIQMAPDSPYVRLKLARMYLHIKRYDDAAREFKELVRTKPTDPFVHVRLGETYGMMKRTEDADREFNEAVRLKPESASVRRSLAKAHDRLSRYDDAIKEYKEAIRLKLNDAGTHYDLGSLYDKLNRYDGAVNEYKEVVRIDPNKAYSHYALGYIYNKYGQYKQALPELLAAVKLDPKDSNSHVSLGTAYLQMKRPKDAVAEYARALQIDPNNLYAHIGLGTTYLRLGKIDDSLREYREAVQIDPKSPDAVYSLGHAYVTLHNRTKAMEQYKALKPLNAEWAKELLKNINKT